MKKILVIILLTICAGIYAQKGKSYQCYWHENGTDVFKSPDLFRYSEKGRFYYCIMNDSDNIYLDIRIFDNDVQRQVINSGITVWINTEGEKSKKKGIKFPVRMQNGSEGGPSDNQNYQVKQQFNNSRKTRQQQSFVLSKLNDERSPDYGLQLIGFPESGPEIISPDEKNNFRGSLRMEKDLNMYYEVIMPLSRLKGIDENVKREKKEESLILGISHNEVLTSGRDVSAERAHGMSARGYGGERGMSGGGMRGGGSRMSGGRGRMSGGFEGRSGARPGSDSRAQTIIWIKSIKPVSK